MLTTLEIENKRFNKSLFGYNIDQVNDFLDKIIESYEKIHMENTELKDEISILTQQIKHYDELEKTLRETLVVAQTTADEVIESAKKEAEITIQEAESISREELKKLEARREYLDYEYRQMEKNFNIFRNKYLSFLENQSITVKEFSSDIVEFNKEEDLE